jgi:hypothetical protein
MIGAIFMKLGLAPATIVKFAIYLDCFYKNTDSQFIPICEIGEE